MTTFDIKLFSMVLYEQTEYGSVVLSFGVHARFIICIVCLTKLAFIFVVKFEGEWIDEFNMKRG